MIVDTSVLIAILKPESDGPAYFETLAKYDARLFVSAAAYLEAGIVVDSRKDDERSAQLDQLLTDCGLEIAAITESQARIARAAYRKFGKGSGHKARLNFGDCFAYALSKERGEPLLFKGNDFSQTDIESAL